MMKETISNPAWMTSSLMICLREDQSTLMLMSLDPFRNKKNAEIEDIRGSVKDNETLNEEQQKRINTIEAEVRQDRDKLNTLITDYASQQPVIGQLIDLALLGNGLLRGEDLSKFISRSISLL